MAGHALYGIAPCFGHTGVTFEVENDRPGPGVTGNLASQGIWHHGVTFPRDNGILSRNLASPQGIWHPLEAQGIWHTLVLALVLAP